MDHATKGSPEYKRATAARTFDVGFKGDCSKLEVTPRVPRARGTHHFSGATGVSIVGEETNVALPVLDTTLDCGYRCDQFLERNLLVSHYDGDHVEGIGKAICKAITTGNKLDIFLPRLKHHKDLKKVIKVFKKQDKKRVIKLHEMKNGSKVTRGDMMVEAFDVYHAPESKGYVIWKRGKDKTWTQELTYTGDINPGKMNVNIPQFTKSRTLVIDGSYSGAFLPVIEPLLGLFTSHASTNHIKKIAEMESELKNIGVIHLPRTMCFDIESDIRRKFANENEHVYYLDSCGGDGVINPLNKRATFKRVT